MFINVSLCVYKFRHWCFQWKQDEEGDIVFVIFNCIGFVKYKEHTIVKFGKIVKEYISARKYQGASDVH